MIAKSAHSRIKTPPPTPAPMPAFAPVLNPDPCDELLLELVLLDSRETVPPVGEDAEALTLLPFPLAC